MSEAAADQSDSDAGAGQPNGSTDLAARATASMITTASVGVVVENPADAALAVSELVDQSGGRVTAREEVAASVERDEQAWAHLTVRIPADQMTSVLAALSTLGSVENATISSTDVSTELTDLSARIDALRVSASRLETFMSQASSTAELLEAEATLTERQSDLEALAAQEARLADQVALSTVTIKLTTSPQAVPEPEEAATGFWAGLTTGWDALTSTLTVVVMALGVALPWLALAGAGYVIFRWVRRRVRLAASQPL